MVSSAIEVMKIKREDFLTSLEKVKPGLSTKGTTIQSTCFVFKDGMARTFDGELACCYPLPDGLPLEGAVRADKLLDVLGKMQEEDIGLEIREAHLVVLGKGRKYGVTMEKDIQLPVESIEGPGEWTKLPDDFLRAVAMVLQCACGSEMVFFSTVLHIHPDWLETGDPTEICRWQLATGFAESCLVRRAAAKCLFASGVSEFSLVNSWVHFRSSDGLLLSLRRYDNKYPDMTRVYAVQGEPVDLPDGLEEEARGAAIFSKENMTSGRILVEMRPGLLRVSGQGPYGFYTGRPRKTSYQGKNISFLIAADLLVSLARAYDRCEVSGGKLKVVSGDCTCVACLYAPRGDANK